MFAVVEVAGGLVINSLAIVADALHDLGDSFMLGISWYLERYAEKEKDKTFSYGYRRFSLLSALASAIVMIVGSLLILSEALPRIIEPQESHATGMMLLACIGIAVNGYAFLKIRRGETMNARMIAWHLLEDVLGWIAVFAVGMILYFKELHVLDPILSVLITLYVLFNVVKYLKATAFLFLQAVPEGLDIRELERQLLSVPAVESLHHTHL